MSSRARATAILAAWVGAISIGSTAHAAGPAVRAVNGRVGAGYVWTHFEEDSPTSALESDSHQGFLTGTLTMPLGESLGLRVNLLPNYGHRDSEPDPFFGLDLDTDFGGIEAGGELFWRDPERFEIGVGARYSWQEIEFESGLADDQTVHDLDGLGYGSWFLSPDTFWPVDLNAYFLYSGIDLDESIGDRVQEAWSIGGDVRLYPLDGLAVSLGGFHRELDSHAVVDSETSGAVFGFDALVHRKPGLTLGPRFEVGKRDSSTFLGTHFSQTYYSLAVRVTMSFPGADSLVELSRNVY